MARALAIPFIFSVLVSDFVQSIRATQSTSPAFPTDCKSSFHNNFYVHQGTRFYYDGIPDFIQVGDHQFVEHKVIKNWIDLMLCGW